MASLFVIQGADQGKRFEFKTSPVPLGRDNSNAIRLHDTEVSRRHAEIRLEDEAYRIVDLGSANGTFVNGHLVDQAPLHTGDRLQLGQTVMLYNEGALGARRDLTARVDLLSKSSPEDRSAILRSIPSDEGSRILQQPDGAAGWLRERLTNLSVMYRATQAVSHILEIEATDKDKPHGSVRVWGALGVGGLKMKIHRKAIQALFESNDKALDAEQVLELGSTL